MSSIILNMFPQEIIFTHDSRIILYCCPKKNTETYLFCCNRNKYLATLFSKTATDGTFQSMSGGTLSEAVSVYSIFFSAVLSKKSCFWKPSWVPDKPEQEVTVTEEDLVLGDVVYFPVNFSFIFAASFLSAVRWGRQALAGFGRALAFSSSQPMCLTTSVSYFMSFNISINSPSDFAPSSLALLKAIKNHL